MAHGEGGDGRWRRRSEEEEEEGDPAHDGRNLGQEKRGCDRRRDATPDRRQLLRGTERGGWARREETHRSRSAVDG